MPKLISLGYDMRLAHALRNVGYGIVEESGKFWVAVGPNIKNIGIRFIVTDEVVKGNNGMFTKKDRIRAQRINKAKKRVKKAIEYFMGEHTSLRQREEAYLKLEKKRKHLLYLTKGSES